MALERPSLVAAWSDRFMIAADEGNVPVRVYYRDHRTGKAVTHNVPDDLARLVQFLGHKQTPENPAPGLGMTYSEVVGALYAIQQQGAVAAAFATGHDRMMARLLEAADQTALADRPESSERQEEEIIFRPEAPRAATAQGPVAPGGSGEARKPSLIVPLNNPAPADAGGSGGTGGARPEGSN